MDEDLEVRCEQDQLMANLVAAHRRLVALLREVTDDPRATYSGMDVIRYAIRLGATISDSETWLAALDEASER